MEMIFAMLTPLFFLNEFSEVYSLSFKFFCNCLLGSLFSVFTIWDLCRFLSAIYHTVVNMF